MVKKVKKVKDVVKPWGHERWLSPKGCGYLLKIIEIHGGEKLSLQYHKEKHETLYLVVGSAKVYHNKEEKEVNSLDFPEDKVFVIKPNDKHRIEAITDCIFVEGSTEFPDDVVRVEDKYGRGKKKG